MKEIEEGIHEVHAKAREKRNNEKESQEDKEMTGKTGMMVWYKSIKHLKVKIFSLFKLGKKKSVFSPKCQYEERYKSRFRCNDDNENENENDITLFI